MDANKGKKSHSDNTTKEWFDHSSGKRTDTDVVIARALREQYPQLELVIAPTWGCDLLGFAQSGHATFTPLEDPRDPVPTSVSWTGYAPPATRLGGGGGGLIQSVVFGKFLYKWRDGEDFILYVVDGRDGNYPYGATKNNYILASDKRRADALVFAAGAWSNELHDEIWVFDGGYWQKSRELFESTRAASWENVILDDAMKKAIIGDHLGFFAARESYTRLKVPWKRGIIYYGPPGNGKTISIKATMNMLWRLKDQIPTLYVRTLTSWAGPEASIKLIFSQARRLAPCYLVFEDLDTIVSDNVRSYFLNEVDGLKSNDGIFMIGSTNHLDRLDPGISKRPSRFDRKYFFPDPNRDERIAYCHFWQHKLAKNDEIKFPDKLCDAIADITDKFSFAYIQEAFVAALLAIARRSGDGGDGDDGDDSDDEALVEGAADEDWVSVVSSAEKAQSFGGGDDDGDDPDLDDLVLWVEIKKQIEILREGMEEQGVAPVAAVADV